MLSEYESERWWDGMDQSRHEVVNLNGFPKEEKKLFLCMQTKHCSFVSVPKKHFSKKTSSKSGNRETEHKQYQTDPKIKRLVPKIHQTSEYGYPIHSNLIRINFIGTT